jgi:hypothetical protein
MVAAPAESCRQGAPALPNRSRQPAACQSKSPFGPRAGLSGDAARVAEIDPICLHIAFRSPEGHDAESAENDWLPAAKRAMCVSIF